jgi:hypothetical protein
LLDLLLQIISLGTTCDFDQRGQPVERGEQLVLDRTRLDVSRPADNAWSAVAAFVGLTF